MAGNILVAFASQTGAAEAIAWRSANALIGAGRFVRVAPLGGLDPAALAEAGTLLVVTSTYGTGEAPDSAHAFVRRHMGARADFSGVSFAVLALGDRKYDATFCQFGRGLDRWLAEGGGRRLFDVSAWTATMTRPPCPDGASISRGWAPNAAPNA